MKGQVAPDWLREGNGCAHCYEGRPITRVGIGGRIMELCLGCTLGWFPSKDAAWFESRHAPFRDHTEWAIKRARERETERNLQARMGGQYGP